jgi:hypothetical protein
MTMAGRKNERYVVPSPSGGWNVKKPGQKTPESHHRTQASAERAAKEALRKVGGEVRIQGRDGRFRDSDTVPPARDPTPPKDTRH